MGNCQTKRDQEGTLQGIPKIPINYYTCEGSDSREVNVEGIEAEVKRVHINGIARTNDVLVKDAVRILFKAKDLQDVLIKIEKVKEKLHSLGCFRNISVFIDTSKTDPSHGGIEITFHVKEFKRIVGGVNTEVGCNNEGLLSLALAAPNLFGGGERLQYQYCYGSKKTAKSILSINKPFPGCCNPLFTASVFQKNHEWPISSYKDKNNGIILDLGFNSLPYINHNVQWEMVMRDILPIGAESSMEVREDAGTNLKSALKHILSIDLRNDSIFPSCGSMLQFCTEVAGVGGNVGFIKNDLELQSNFTLSGATIQASLCGGHLYSFGNDWKTSISDMYFLGGPLCLRGFKPRGVGPQSEGDSLGSEWFWLSALHLYTPIPGLASFEDLGEVFRMHSFFNMGSIGNYKNDEERPGLTDNIRMAYGLGLAIRVGELARIELNYCIPVRYSEEDTIQKGFQFGIGLEFL